MNTAPPLVSVMIPYYNCKAYIAETIESVEQQTHSNIEIIIIDDGSTQEHRDYLQNYLAGKPHIRYAFQENQGVSSARNYAARLAGGKYFLFLDADDVILPEYTAKAVAILESNPDCKLVYPQAEFFGVQSGLWEIPPYEDFRSLLMGNKFPSISFHRATDYRVLDGFDESLDTHEDWDYWIRILKNGGTVYQIPEILFKYRRRSSQDSLIDKLSANPELNRLNWQKVCNKHQDLFLQYNLGYVDLVHLICNMKQHDTEQTQKIQTLENEVSDHVELTLFANSMEQKNMEQTKKIQELEDKLGKLKQAYDNARYRESMRALHREQQSDSTPSPAVSINGHAMLRYIYKSPSYQIIRAVKKLNWKIKKRPKKPLFFPTTEIQSYQEAVRILNSTAWSLLSPIHFLYKLIKKEK
ncbi:glycosyltransferase family 2 protein [Neisseria animalis]|uniref:Glycosyltransferase family 2 protein n=1 Tax=Neisseria animalis TaxID=492 RepID=A0A5P3MPN0_NEIAN|nr:glycosyltransferase family A protein [Neisseria animalis]QEY23507.1 glycosyltransferase family 2 protein [Neisseria animalis]ROW33353.1 glycosyltransferase family 2 protein [Neisseria animalis]VEE09098.1 glycosyltransferase [Neisseria animalis]